MPQTAQFGVKHKQIYQNGMYDLKEVIYEKQIEMMIEEFPKTIMY